MTRRDDGRRPAAMPRWRRLAAVAALLVLAPWSAECSWGGFTVADFPSVIIFLGPMYGGAAVLIRETARRTGGGWPTIVLLAAAFGVFQAGLVDQSLFNPEFLTNTQFAMTETTAAATRVPGLGISVEQTLVFVGNHVALSVCAPIAITESIFAPGRRQVPWLRRPGLLVIAVVYLAGSLLIFTDDGGRGDFLAEPGQLAAAGIVVVLLVGIALSPRWRRRRRPTAGRAPRPIVPGLLMLATSITVNLVDGWLGITVSLVFVGVTAAAIVRWSRRRFWGKPHVLASWGAVMMGAATIAYLVPTYEPASPAMSLLSDVVVSMITVTLLTTAFWRLRTHPLADGSTLPVATP